MVDLVQLVVEAPCIASSGWWVPCKGSRRHPECVVAALAAAGALMPDEAAEPLDSERHQRGDFAMAAIAMAIYAWWQLAEHCGWTKNMVEEIVLERWWPDDSTTFRPSDDAAANLRSALRYLVAELDRLKEETRPEGKASRCAECGALNEPRTGRCLACGQSTCGDGPEDFAEPEDE